jgi:DNA-binding protein H-NS
MPTLSELIAQKTAIEKQITAARQREVGDAVAKVRALVDEYQLTAADIFTGSKTKKTAKTGNKTASKVAAKYKNPETGATWTGRGITPKWLAGKNKADFLIT